MTGWLSHRHIYHLSRAVVISYYTCKVSCNHLYLSISKWSRCIFSVLWKGKLREKEVQWVLLGPTVWQREFQVRSETCCLLSKLLRAPLLPVTVSGKCKFVKDAVRRIGPRGLCAFTDFPGCLCTARDSTANHVIHTRCLRTGESITCSSTGWDCSLQWKIKNRNKQQLIIFLCESFQKHRKSNMVLLCCWHKLSILTSKERKFWLLNLLAESDPWPTLWFLFKNRFGVILYALFLLPRK